MEEVDTKMRKKYQLEKEKEYNTDNFFKVQSIKFTIENVFKRTSVYHRGSQGVFMQSSELYLQNS